VQSREDDSLTSAALLGVQYGSSITIKEVLKMKAASNNEVFVGADGLVYTSGSVCVQGFGEPLLDLWLRVYERKRPRQIKIRQGECSTVWRREALLAIAHLFGKGRPLDRPEEYRLPEGSTYADLASDIERRWNLKEADAA
jgi:hypothetical protein